MTADPTATRPGRIEKTLATFADGGAMDMVLSVDDVAWLVRTARLAVAAAAEIRATEMSGTAPEAPWFPEDYPACSALVDGVEGER